jgi:RNA-directed DNA polymerase
MRVPKYFLDAGIKGSFDNINHSSLINKLNTIPMIRHQIEAWLKAGIIKDTSELKLIETNDLGTPQSSVITPLLCNIAFTGFEKFILKKFSRDAVKIIRYADDFMIMGKNLKDIQKAQTLAEEFLETIGLELSKEKTRIGHTLDVFNKENFKGKPGFDFLGFYFRNRQVSIHRGIKNTKGKMTIFTQESRPSKSSIKNHRKNLKNILRKYKTQPREAVIKRLSQSIKG